MRKFPEVPHGETSTAAASVDSRSAAACLRDACIAPCSAADTPTSSAAHAMSPRASAPPSAGIFSFLSSAPQPSSREEATTAKKAGGSLEEAAYTLDTKGLRYMSFGALAKIIVSHFLSHFFSDSSSTADAEGIANGRKYVLNSAGTREATRNCRINSVSSFYAQEYYEQLAVHVMRRKNEAAVALPPSPDARGPTAAAARGKCADVAKNIQPEPGCHTAHAKLSSLHSRCSPIRLREFVAGREDVAEVNSADEVKCRSAYDSRQEVFAGIISIKKLAMLDAGVYVRPDLSEILKSHQEANQVQWMLRRCGFIDTKICALKKKVNLVKLSSDVGARWRDPHEDGAVSNTGGEGRTLVGDTGNKVRTESGMKIYGTSLEKNIPDTIPCANVCNTRRTETDRNPADAFYAAAASAEIVVLRQEKQQLRRQLADVRALLEYVWKYWGLAPAFCMNAEQFSRAFCSNEEDTSQQHAAAILFDLCDIDSRGSVTFEELFSRLPLLAMEVMFIVTAMERKARQAYRYYWI